MPRHRARGRIRVGGNILTNAAGNASVVYGPVFGTIEAISVRRGTWTDAAADITVTDTLTGVVLLTITNATGNARYPLRDLITTQAGADIIAALTSTDPYDKLSVHGTITVAVAQGGNALTGSVYIDVDEGQSDS